ncbi:hypothetical protein AA313_de0200604 [Arthrobotrys entomopaga]|nr:hypothetical protein AA313_de0200604 [Arthrobotrys entomopaga]
MTARVPRPAANFSTSRATYSKLESTARRITNSTSIFSRTTAAFNGSISTAKSAFRRLATAPTVESVVATAKTRTAATEIKKSSFPETSERIVAFWLLGSASLVFAIVVVGGLTRLTESGLSITEWKPVTGTLPPLNAADWESEFSKYRDSPEFRLLNSSMTLEEYKFIYFMEWTHRLLGRVIGVSFVLPAIYFVARRKVSSSTAMKLGAIALDDLFQQPGAHPRVSQYRLTAHLGAAFAVYAGMLYTGVSILRENRSLKDPKKAADALKKRSVGALLPLRIFVGLVSILVFTTAMSGALVAGLDAGLIYNEFPTMAGGFGPPMTELFDPFYSREPPPHNDLIWRNLFENPSTVQFNHRMFAMTTFFTVLSLWGYGRRLNRKKVLTPEAKKGIMGLVHLVSLQVALGISTLLYLVPHTLASLHQANSLLLLTGCLVLGSRVWVPRALLKIAEKRVAMMGKRSRGVKKVENSNMAM